jgi:hypothetical protein
MFGLVSLRSRSAKQCEISKQDLASVLWGMNGDCSLKVCWRFHFSVEAECSKPFRQTQTLAVESLMNLLVLETACPRTEKTVRINALL